MSMVRDLMQKLTDDGFMNVEFAHTGGGCHAIRIPLGASEEGDFSEFLITGEDVFTAYDLDHDDDVNGEWFADRYDENGDSVTDSEGLYHGTDVDELIAALNASLDAIVPADV